jgi:hypothetical protein
MGCCIQLLSIHGSWPVSKSTTRSMIRNSWQSSRHSSSGDRICWSSTSSPSSNRSQESPLFHNYLDLESLPSTLVYFPSRFRLWDLVSTRHPSRERWRAISLFRIWTSTRGWGLRPAKPDFIQPRTILSCSNNQHPPRLIPCKGHQDGN